MSTEDLFRTVLELLWTNLFGTYTSRIQHTSARNLAESLGKKLRVKHVSLKNFSTRTILE